MADPRYRFVHGDICDAALVDALVGEERPDAIVHFAAESHVDRSILSPEPVVRDQLATAPSPCWKPPGGTSIARFVHVSTDEVYGSLEAPARSRRELSAESQQPVFGIEGRPAICWRAPTSSPSSCRW